MPLLGVMFLTGALVSGCRSYFMDQVAVPNTKQRLVVGQYVNVFASGAPSRQVWVIDGGKLEPDKVKEAVRP